MPTDACRFFYECTGCSARLRPKVGDCSVFCSYGSVPCPPVQAARSGDRSCCRCWVPRRRPKSARLRAW